MDVVYLKFEAKIQTDQEKVYVSDVAEIVCRNDQKKEQIRKAFLRGCSDNGGFFKTSDACVCDMYSGGCYLRDIF